MKRATSILLLFLFLGSALSQNNYWGNNYNNPPPSTDSVLMTSINTLTFNLGEKTAARRSYAVPQLKCVGGSAYSRTDLHPQVVQCTNMGTDGSSIQWKCESELDKSVKFGKTVVSCEGYTNSQDPYVLKGSCGLEYNLDYSSATPHQKPKSRAYDNRYHDTGHKQYPQQESSSFGSVLSFLVFGIIIYSLYKMCLSAGNGGARYADNSQYTSSSYPDGYPPGNTGNYGGQGQANGGFNPGFWGGLGGGSVLGYLFGRGRGYYNNYNQPRTSFWGGNNNNGYNNGYNYNGGYDNSSYNSYSNPSYSNPTYSSSPPSSRRSPSPTRTATTYATTNNR